MIWLAAEIGKIIVLHVRRAFKCIPSMKSAKWLRENSHNDISESDSLRNWQK